MAKKEKTRTLPELGTLPDDALINESEARSFYNIGRTTFWRGWGTTFPSPLKFGGLNRWRMGAIRKGIRGQE
jgi:predicted DNA-binding transcriptional regulator AlpA